jgi:RNA polymerase sigma-70 factor (ECF subfamily)
MAKQGASAQPGAAGLARLKRRESHAWSQLFEQEYPLVFRAVLGRVRDRTVAEDIAAQVFLEAMEGIGRYRDRGKPITAWLLTIARHRSHDWFRKASREVGGEVPEPMTHGPEADLTVALDALALLTDDQREVIHLRFVEGYSLEETGERTGRSAGAVKSLQHRGLARLRGLLSENEGVR